MTDTIKTARHRSACRPRTPLSTFGQAVTGPMGRRAAVAAASSGIILSLGAPAVAAPTTDDAPVEDANFSAVADAAQAVADDSVATAATVSVEADQDWALGTTTAVSAEAPPEPEPEPESTSNYERSSNETSRSNERTPADDSGEAAEAEESSDDAGAAASSDASGIRAQIVDIAFRYVGTPYVLGGTTPSAFDCSGFTQYVYAQAGIDLPRTTGAQRGAGQVVSAAEAKPGDLVWAPGHVGIYLGGDQHIAARQPGTPLQAGPIYMSNPTFIRVVD